MKMIYLDNGSTSFPKAPGVGAVMGDFLENVGVNVARGGYAAAYDTADRILEAREKLCRLFGFGEPRNVIFTSGVTESLNVLLRGFLRPGDHVLTTAMEHNAVMRPLTRLSAMGIAFDRVPCDKRGELLLEKAEKLLRPNTRAFVMLHASNVCGSVMPLEAVSAFCRGHGLRLILDAAQTAGAFPIDMSKTHIDALAFTGHKGLMGPQGIGGFLIDPAMAGETEPLITGGTGSSSDMETQPEFLPDKFEAGTQNIPGILGLGKALDFILDTGVEVIRRRESSLARRLMEGFSDIRGVALAGPGAQAERTAVVSVDLPGLDNAECAAMLEAEYGVLTRCGLQCAPSAHKTLGTFPQGTIRFVPGFFTTDGEVDAAVAALAGALSKMRV